MTSPSLSIVPKRLSSRRGSASANDPFNAHAALNHHPDRGSFSTLTIVRLPSAQNAPASPQEQPPSPILGQRRHRRPGSGATTTPQTPQALAEPSPQPQSSRLSFAFSSFSGSSPTSGSPSARDGRDRAPSPSSPRMRPQSPRQTTSSQFSSKPRLGPEQIVDLARLSINPRPGTTALVSPAPLSSSPPHTPARNQAQSPSNFTPLPEDIYLPFIDRPSEVTALISSPPDAKLFALLAQTIGSKKDPDSDVPLERSSDLPTDPVEWTYRHLVFHLTKLDRETAPDTIWAYAVRKCVISRSELIWERVKGALGIPPELDVDWDFNHRNDDNSDSDSIRTEDISDDEGRAARGHWSDWDATMDSPVFDKRIHLEAPFSPTSPAAEPENQVVIEQITVPPPSFSTAPPPLSLPLSLSSSCPSDGLGDIAEGAEEEEEGGTLKVATVGIASPQNELPATSQIHGLKISTMPVPVVPRDFPPMLPFASSPLPFTNTAAILVANKGSSYIGSRPHSRSNSVSSSVGPFRRTDSNSNIAALLSSFRQPHSSGGSDAGDSSSVLSDLHLADWVSESRAAGVPLFPSNFARLTVSPTLTRPNSKNSSRTRALSHGASSLSGSILKRQSWGTVPSSVPGTGSVSGSE